MNFFYLSMEKLSHSLQSVWGNYSVYKSQVWEWIRNVIPHLTGHVVIHPCSHESYSVLVKRDQEIIRLCSNEKLGSHQTVGALTHHIECKYIVPLAVWWHTITTTRRGKIMSRNLSWNTYYSRIKVHCVRHRKLLKKRVIDEVQWK